MQLYSYTSHDNSKEKLVKCCELRADETIKQHALRLASKSSSQSMALIIACGVRGFFPDSLGWKLDHENSELSVDWMDGLPAPLSLLELLTYTCSRKCEAPTCPCITN